MSVFLFLQHYWAYIHETWHDGISPSVECHIGVRDVIMASQLLINFFNLLFVTEKYNLLLKRKLVPNLATYKNLIPLRCRKTSQLTFDCTS